MSWIQWLRALASTPSVSKMPVHGSTRFEYSAVDVRYWSTVTTNGIFSSAFLRVRTFANVSALPSLTVSTGESWMRLPSSAAALPMRPPRCRNVSVSGVNRKRVDSMPRSAAAAHPARSSPASRAATASNTGHASS